MSKEPNEIIIMNEMELQQAEYKNEVRYIWLKQAPIIFLIGFVVSFLFMSGFAKFTGTDFSQDHWIMACMLALMLMYLPIWIIYPDRPTEDSINYGKVLNDISCLANKNK